MKFIREYAKKVFRLLGYDIVRIRKKSPYPTDINPAYAEIINSVQEYTMTSVERLNGLLSAVDYITDNKIEGDYVECGVWRGGSTMAAALRLIERKQSHRKLYLYDTFEGMPAPTRYDFSKRSGEAQKKFEQVKISEMSSDWCYADIQDVKRNMALTRYPIDKVTFVRGKVEDTVPQQIPSKIAILRLDTDWYASTKHEMEHLFPILEKGGVLIIDDYGHWEGCRKAIDEYFTNNKIPYPLLARLDYTGRMAIKS